MEGKKEFLRVIMNKLKEDYPRAVGMVVLFLDCGCIHANLVSIKGENMGPGMRLNPSGFDSNSNSIAVCVKCIEEEIVNPNRVTHEGMAWYEPHPDKKTMEMIKEKVFGFNPSLLKKGASKYPLEK